MLCPRCNTEMTNTIGGNYNCPKCGFAVNDLVYRESKTIPDISIETPKNYNKNIFGKVGWICPKCNRGVSPYVNICPCTESLETKINSINNNTITKTSPIHVTEIQGICATEISKPEIDAHINVVLDDLNNSTSTHLTSKVDYVNQST